MEPTGHSEIMMILGEIRGDVKGINQRLDTLNGSVAKTKDDILTLRIADSGIESRLKPLEEQEMARRDEERGRKSIWYQKGVDMSVTLVVSTLAALGITQLNK